MAEERAAAAENNALEKQEASDIVEVITKQNPRLFNGIDKAKTAQILAAFSIGIAQVQKTHSGPLPDIETLEGYANIIPNGAERVMAMAEKEQDFRHEYNRTVARRQLNQVSRGQWLGFVLSLSALGGGIWLTFIGKDVAGLSTIILALGGLMIAFIWGKASENK